MRSQLIWLMCVSLSLVAISSVSLADEYLQLERANKLQVQERQEYPASDSMMGGETIETAVEIPGLPFSDTGNTCGAIDDYDSPCGEPSDSPDLVYAYTAMSDMTVVIDLCNSGYDTKIIVYEDEWSDPAFGCDDDFHGSSGPCFPWTSMLKTIFSAGHVYYIVVDGYGGECGDYQIDISEYDSCLDCPAEAMDEGEGPLPYGYIDQFNSGCDRPYHLFTPVVLPASDGCIGVCGIGGAFYSGPGMYWYDSDWYEMTATTEMLGISVSGDGFLYVEVWEPDPDCDNMIATGSFQVEGCQLHEQAFTVIPGNTYWVRVYFEFLNTDLVWSPAEYVIDFCSYDVVVTETATWGAVKALYR